MAHNPAAELASAIQSTHIVRNPSPHHDVNPSTAASKLIPADVPSPDLSEIEDDDAASDIPSDVINPIPRPRRKSFPPLPDMRFEQSYLASIKNAETKSQVAIITIRDQVLLPLLQGTLWNFVLFGWRHWNRGAKFQGTSIGARVRKWWWEVNNWKMPNTAGAKQRAEFARGAQDYYVNKAGTSLAAAAMCPLMGIGIAKGTKLAVATSTSLTAEYVVDATLSAIALDKVASLRQACSRRSASAKPPLPRIVKADEVGCEYPRDIWDSSSVAGPNDSQWDQRCGGQATVGLHSWESLDQVVHFLIARRRLKAIATAFM